MKLFVVRGLVVVTFLGVPSWDALFSSRAAPFLQIGQNFTGTTSQVEPDVSPPDTEGAAGLGYFVEFINGQFVVYDKITAAAVQTKRDLDFWKNAGITFGSSIDVTDPRLIFDPASQRWFASMVDFNGNARRLSNNRFLLAVSNTSDPTGSWSGFAFQADPVSLDFADFPTLGLDANGVYLSGDMFDRQGNELGPSLVVIPKSDLLASQPTVANRTSLGNLSYITHGTVLQPAVTTGSASSPEFMLATQDTLTDTQPLTVLIASTFLDSSPTNATLARPVRVTVPGYLQPLDPSQPDGTANLDVGDLRFSAAVRRVGDGVYAVHSVEENNRAAIRWYRFHAPDNTLVESGTISDPTLDLYYPSIAANEFGTVVIGCSGSSPAVFVSSYAVAGEIVNGSLVFGDLMQLAAGSASYQNTDATGSSRWGDYSATTVDPEDPNRFWTIQTIALDSTTWATQITELITGIHLTVVASEAGVVVSWPAVATGFGLESSSTLAPSGSWTPVTQAPSIQDGVASVVLSASENTAFFRLSSPSAR